MIKLSVMYPNTPSARFDHAYYRLKHMPLIKVRLGDGCKRNTGQQNQTDTSRPIQNDDLSNIRRRRLLFRCWHRGTQESDVILGSFADTHLAGLDETQLERFEELLDCPDPDLFDWILGGVAPPAEHDHDVLQMLRASCVQRDQRKIDRSAPDPHDTSRSS